MKPATSPRSLCIAVLGCAGALAMAGGCSDDDTDPRPTAGPTGPGSTSSSSGSGGDGAGGEGGAGGQSMNCTPGATLPCYYGPPGTDGVGVCQAGVQTCDAEGLFYGACEGQVTPGPKNCATPDVDESCDGSLGPCTNPPLFAALYGVTGDQIGFAVAADPAQNILFTGTYEQGIDFGAGPLGAGGMFLVKLDPSGGVIWQKSFDGGFSRSVRADSQGNVILYGLFDGTIDLGGGPLSSGAGEALFLAKFAADGQHVFSKAFLIEPLDHWDWVAAVDPADEIVITGAFQSTIDLGGGPLVSAGSEDVFVAKLDAMGNHLWSKRFGDAADQLGATVAIGAQGQVVLAGWFEGAIDFGGGPLVADSNDLYVAQLDAAGDHVWSKVLGGQGNQVATGVAIDPIGDIAVVGGSSGSVDLGGGPLQAEAASYVCFVGKLSSSGEHVWSMAHGCEFNMFVPLGPRVAADPNGAFVVTGSFNGTTDFGQGPVASLGNDAFVFTLGTAGAPLASRTFSSASYDQGLDVACDPSGNVLLTGHVENDTDFGGGLLGSNGDFDAYLVKLGP